MKCTNCGFDNPDYLEYCRNCSAQLPKADGEQAKPTWGFVKAPQWAEPDFSADSVSEDDVPADFVSEIDTGRLAREAAERRAAAEEAAKKAKRAAEAAAAAQAAENARAAERKAYEERRAAERRAAEDARAAERRAEEERLMAERRAAERRAQTRKPAAYDYEDEEIEDEEEENPRGLSPLFGNIFKRKDKPSRKYDDEYDDEDEDEEEEERYTVRRTSGRGGKKSGGGFNLQTAIKIAAIVALLAILAVAGYLIVSRIQSCAADNASPTGTAKAPVITPNVKEPGTYLVTVYAKNGKVLVYETSDGTKQEATVKYDDTLTFKVHEISLMPTEPLDGSVCQATPKVYIKNDDGSLTPIENMPAVTLNVPAITVTYDCPDSIVSEDGKVNVSGHIDYIGTDLTVDGEKVAINQDGSFAHEVVYEDTGDYSIDIEGRLGGYQIYRHRLNVTVEKATPATALIELPWEYGDTTFAQRVKNSSDTITVKAKAPAGSTVAVSCDSSNASVDNANPTVGEDGSFSFNVKMAYAGDYVIHMTCTSESGQVSDRDIHVQRAPEWSSYTGGAFAFNYSSFSYASKQAYNVKGTITEIMQDGDYILAVLETADGNKLLLEYHNHYGSAGAVTVGQAYEKIYGRPDGIDEATGLPKCYVWFIDD